jgi:two-component system, sensor histidine kinase SagS
MTRALATQRLLVLTGTSTRAGDLVDSLAPQYDVTVVHSLDDALAALRSGTFDGVLSDSADFLPLERAVEHQQGGMILDTIGEGICIANPAGKILWANRRMNGWPQEVRDRITAACQEAYAIFSTQTGPTDPDPAHAAPGASRGKKYSLSIGDSLYFELLCSPVLDSSRKVTQIVAICWDATSGKRQQQKIDAIDQAGQELVRLESENLAKLNVGQRLKLLEEKVIRYCRQLMHFDHFAIRLLDRRTNKLELVICVGMPTEAMEVELFAAPEGNGISGYVASTARSYMCNDIRTDPRYVVGLNNALSSLTVPLMLHDKVIGIFNIESSHVSNFSEDDRQFAEIFGRYVALALNILDLLVVERYTTTTGLAQNVTSEIAGPLNDIVSEATVLMDEYIGDELMRKRLQGIVENVSRIRRAIKEVAEGPKTITGVDAAAPEKARDPVLAGKRILVADDEPNIRQTIADLLTRFGCVIDTAKDGAEAIALLASRAPYDLVLSDIKMPHKNGYEIFAAAKKLGHAPPVILMTGFGYDPAHSIVRASQEGLAAVLFKPFKVDQLMGEIRKAVSIRK